MSIRVNIASVFLLLTISKAEFRGQFPYLDKLKDIELIPRVQPIRLSEIRYLVFGI